MNLQLYIGVNIFLRKIKNCMQTNNFSSYIDMGARASINTFERKRMDLHFPSCNFFAHRVPFSLLANYNFIDFCSV
jgi:hypothetical protein